MKLQFVTGKEIDIPFPNLAGAKLDEMYLHRGLFRNANITHTSFRRANLIGALLDGSNATDADFTDAYLMNAYFCGAKLNRAIMIRAQPLSANFGNADLEEADLTDADVSGANFSGASLRGAKLLCKRLDEANLRGAIFDDHTLWPADFNPIEKGAVKVV